MSVKLLTKDGKPLRNHRGEYRYQVRYRIKGKSRTRRIWAKDELSAQVWERQQKDGGVHADEITFVQLMEDFELENIRKPSQYQRDAEYIADIRRSIDEISEVEPIVGAWTIREFNLWVRDVAKTRSARTANKKARQIIHVLKHAYSKGVLLDRLPFDSFQPLNVESYEPKLFPLDRYDEYISVLAAPTRLIVEFILKTGCRQSAARTLTDDRVKADRFLLREKFNEVRVVLRDERLDTILSEAFELRQHYNPSSSYVFIRENGRPWSKNRISYHTTGLWQKNGLEPYGVHSIRAALATRAAEMGATVPEVQSLLGHKSRRASEFYLRHRQPAVAKQLSNRIWSRLEGRE